MSPGIHTNNIENATQFRVSNFSFDSTAAVPEPASLSVFGIGASVMGIAAAGRRRRQQKNALLVV